MKRRVNVGEELEGEIILIERKNKLIDTKVRAVVTITAMLLGSGFVLGSVLLGFVNDPDFVRLQTVWGVIGPIFGLIGGYYFKSFIEK